MLFNLVFSRFYAVFYDLSSLGNFYSFSVDIIVLLFLVGSSTFGMYTLCTYYYCYYFIFLISLFLSADENSNIDIGAILVLLLLLLTSFHLKEKYSRISLVDNTTLKIKYSYLQYFFLQKLRTYVTLEKIPNNYIF